MTTSAQNIPPKYINSNSERSDIASLTSRTNRLSQSADWWNNGYLIFVVLTLIVGAITVVFQYRAVKRGRELADAQALLIQVKDKDTDVKIGEARARAATAEEHAGAANERAGKAEQHLAEANARASEANARAKEAEAQVAKANAASKDAVAKVAAAEARIAEANRAASEANAIAERERLARLQLEARLADRTLTAEQQARLTAALMPFRGTEVDIVIFGDTPEISIIAGMILDCLHKAG